MEEPASWCRSGHCQKDLQRQSQHQAHRGHHPTRFDLSWTYQMPGLNYPSPPPSFHLSDGPVSCSAHHGLPFCLEPTEWDSSAYSGGFFALTNFLGQSSAERRTDVYVLTFTAPVDGQTGRMGETLCLLPPIFSFSQLFTKMSTPFPGQYLICRFVSFDEHFSQLYLVVQHWEEHEFDCTLLRVYNRIFTFFREERGSTQLAVTFMYWHLSLASAILCKGTGENPSLNLFAEYLQILFPTQYCILFNLSQPF